jgi:hypothetical protein
MNKGDKIIWDSKFGWEVGYFLSDSHDVMYNTLEVNLVTGVVDGSIMHSRDEIKPYTKELAKEMKKKYKYSRSFN